MTSNQRANTFAQTGLADKSDPAIATLSRAIIDRAGNILLTGNHTGASPAATALTSGLGIVSTSPTAGVGYAAGAGGAVTQATSKSTGVTLNKATGAITMHNASLADATTATFTVTDSACAAADVPSVVHKSAGTAGAYLVWAHSPAAGSFKISVRNVSGGSLGEAIVLGFVLTKGAIA